MKKQILVNKNLLSGVNFVTDNLIPIKIKPIPVGTAFRVNNLNNRRKITLEVSVADMFLEGKSYSKFKGM